jgi:hypothetical protein
MVSTRARRTMSVLVPVASSASRVLTHVCSSTARSAGCVVRESAMSSTVASAAHSAQQPGHNIRGIRAVNAYIAGSRSRTARRHQRYAPSSPSRSAPSLRRSSTRGGDADLGGNRRPAIIMPNIVAVGRNVDVTRRGRSESPGGQRPGPRSSRKPGRLTMAVTVPQSGPDLNPHGPDLRKQSSI